MKIAFIYAKGRLARLAAVEKKYSANEFFYGSIQLEKSGHSVDLYEIDNSCKMSFSYRMIDWLYRMELLPTKTTASLILQLKEIHGQLNKKNVIVATTTGISYALGVLKLLGFVKPPIVAIHCGLLNYKFKKRRRMLNGFVIRRMWTQLYGDGELNGVRKILHVPKDKVEVNQFGVDVYFWSPAKVDAGKYILSVGNDGRRDYDLLLDVAERIEEKFVLLTRNTFTREIPDNVELIYGDWHAERLTDNALRELYRSAKCVVIPLKDSVQPSGQSVCLQAMACGKPVILTRTRGLWSKDMMREGENVLFVPPEDREALAGRIKELLEDPSKRMDIGRKARDTVQREGNIESFAARLENLCKRVTKLGSSLRGEEFAKEENVVDIKEKHGYWGSSR